MAGVGFELKKMFDKKGGYFHIVKGYCVSAIVTEGPMILCMIMLFSIRRMLKELDTSYAVQEMYLITTTYIMIFSLIFSNTVLMFISRFTSNCIYENRLKDILPSFYAIVFWMLIISGIGSAVYIAGLEKPALHKICNWIQFVVMMIVWIQMSYLSAIKKYVRVLIGFLAAVITAIALAIVFLYLGLEPLTAVFASQAAGFAVMAIMYMQEMIRYFPYDGKTNLFIFLPKLDAYKDLVATGFLTALGLYGHNFVFWFSEYRTEVIPRMVYCMKYDITNFYASLTIIPFLVFFVVSLEVNFYKCYKKYFDSILYDGTYDDIMFENEDLKKTLFRELLHVFEVQFFIEVACITFVGNFLSTIGFDSEMIIMFRYLCMGYCFYVMVKSLIILLLYFDERMGALKVSLLFAVTSILFSAATMYTDIENYGLGFLAAAILSTFYGLFLLRSYVNRLEYNVFCRQPLFADNEEGFFTRLGGYLDGKFDKKKKERT